MTKKDVSKKNQGKNNIKSVPKSIDKILDKILVNGDLSMLTKDERIQYYKYMCQKYELDFSSRPFEFLMLNDRLALYATKACSDQLRIKHGISVTNLELDFRGDVVIAKVSIRDKTGREDMDIGTTTISGTSKLTIADLIMTAVTKAKRRATLSMCGISMLDETEVASIQMSGTNVQIIKEDIKHEQSNNEEREQELKDRQQKIERLKKINEGLRRRMAKYMGLTEGIKFAEECKWDEKEIDNKLRSLYENNKTE